MKENIKQYLINTAAAAILLTLFSGVGMLGNYIYDRKEQKRIEQEKKRIEQIDTTHTIDTLAEPSDSQFTDDYILR